MDVLSTGAVRGSFITINHSDSSVGININLFFIFRDMTDPFEDIHFLAWKTSQEAAGNIVFAASNSKTYGDLIKVKEMVDKKIEKIKNKSEGWKPLQIPIKANRPLREDIKQFSDIVLKLEHTLHVRLTALRLLLAVSRWYYVMSTYLPWC